MATLEFSLYLHIPFCTEKCDYCDFYSVPANRTGWDRLLAGYTEALLLETEQRIQSITSENNSSKIVPSVYIGGGTPSLLGATGIARLLEGFNALIGGSNTREITVEANPETADPDFLQSCREHGVTRLSLGIQSFNETVLKAAGRWGRPLKGISDNNNIFSIDKTFRYARDIFGRGLSVDLMSGLPGQNEEILLNDIEKALSYKPGHISLYALTLEEGTPLAHRSKNKKANTNHNKKNLSEEKSDRLWLVGRDALKKAGYEHYEVSNFAVSPDYRSLHNIRYWLMKNWMGIGPSASGTIINDDGTGIRTTYPADTALFNSAVKNNLIIEELDRNTVLKETLLMGYRYCEGPDPALFLKRFGKTVKETIPETFSTWQKKGDGKPLQETIMCFLNRFLLDAFTELEK